MKPVRKPSQDTPGFTIIEVLIVVSIIGVILIIVFLAVPTLQRNARNYRAKHAAHTVASQMSEYKSVYGFYPDDVDEGNEFIDGYLKDVYKQGFDAVYFVYGHAHDYIPPNGTIAIQFGHWCNIHGNGDNETDPIASSLKGDMDPLNYVVWTTLEPNDQIYCIDSYGVGI